MSNNFHQKELRKIFQVRKIFSVDIKQPLILISQIQRSGGTLLSQLLDGHSQIFAHPHELSIGFPTKYDWPDLDLGDTPKKWFELLFEQYTKFFFTHGYSKYPPRLKREYNDLNDFAFLLSPWIQRKLFLGEIDKRDIRNQRDILDCYMTSYFNAWLDYQGLNLPKKYISGFTPRVSMNSKGTDRFFRDYPDGKLISSIREPKSWFASIRRHVPEKYSDIEMTMELWIQSATAMIRNKKKYGSSVFLINFESLINETELNMRSVAKFLDIKIEPTLLAPTFQGMEIRANSSVKAESYGIIKSPLKRHKDLVKSEKNYIDEEASPLFEEILLELTLL